MTALNDIEKKRKFAAEIAKAAAYLANIVEDYNDAQEEPDERGRGNDAIGLIVFEDGSGFIADFGQPINDNDPLSNSFISDKFLSPEDLQKWALENISERSLFEDVNDDPK